MPNLRLLPVAEAAQILGKDVRTIHRWINRGLLIPETKLPGLRGAYLFTEDEIQRVKASATSAA